MNLILKILCILLGLGAVVSIIESLEFGDVIYQFAMKISSGIFRDFLLLIALSIILYGAYKFNYLVKEK